MIDEPDCSIGPAPLDFFEQNLCIGPRNRQTGNRGHALPERTIRVLIRWEPRSCGVSWVHGDELDRPTLDGVWIASRAMWISGRKRLRSGQMVCAHGVAHSRFVAVFNGDTAIALRVRINQHASRTELLSTLDLNPNVFR